MAFEPIVILLIWSICGFVYFHMWVNDPYTRKGAPLWVHVASLIIAGPIVYFIYVVQYIFICVRIFLEWLFFLALWIKK